jgi:hypothetical protein
MLFGDREGSDVDDKKREKLFLDMVHKYRALSGRAFSAS